MLHSFTVRRERSMEDFHRRKGGKEKKRRFSMYLLHLLSSEHRFQGGRKRGEEGRGEGEKKGAASPSACLTLAEPRRAGEGLKERGEGKKKKPYLDFWRTIPLCNPPPSGQGQKKGGEVGEKRKRRKKSPQTFPANLPHQTLPAQPSLSKTLKEKKEKKKGTFPRRQQCAAPCLPAGKEGGREKRGTKCRRAGRFCGTRRR